MSPYVFTLLISALGLGTTLTFASSHWLLAWMGLEINTLAIIPLMVFKHHPRAVEAATKYFLTQATAAATILFASTTNAWINGQWNIYMMSHPLPVTVIIIALSLKLGLAPLHTWLPEVLQGLDLTTALIMSTWQKLAPFALLIQMPLTDFPILTFLGFASALIGGWAGLNQTQLRKVLAYSSTAHLGWMILVAQFAPSLTALALVMYLFMTTTAFLTLKTTSSTTINGLSTSWAKTPTLTATFPLLLLSLGGLPPLTGFLPKWMILEELAKNGLPLTATLTALAALLSLYFYLRISYALTLTISPNSMTATPLWRLTAQKAAAPLPLAIMLSTLLLPLSPALLATTTL